MEATAPLPELVVPNGSGVSESPSVAPLPSSAEFWKPKIRKRAILYAIGFDLAATFAFGFAFGFLYLVFVSNGSFVFFADLQREIAENKLFIAIATVFGSVISVMAGYLAAQIGRNRPYAHAAWAGSIIATVFFISEYSFLIGVPTKAIEVTFSHMMSILTTPLTIPTYLLGAHLYSLVNRDQHI